MLGLTFDKLILLLALAFFLLGPQRLPHYASKLAQLVKATRQFTMVARDRIRVEVGDDFDAIDWKQLDPRQYDPRRIIREALLDATPPTSPTRRGEESPSRDQGSPPQQSSTLETPPNPVANPHTAHSLEAAASSGSATPPAPDTVAEE